MSDQLLKFRECTDVCVPETVAEPDVITVLLPDSTHLKGLPFEFLLAFTLCHLQSENERWMAAMCNARGSQLSEQCFKCCSVIDPIIRLRSLQSKAWTKRLPHFRGWYIIFDSQCESSQQCEWLSWGDMQGNEIRRVYKRQLSFLVSNSKHIVALLEGRFFPLWILQEVQHLIWLIQSNRSERGSRRRPFV